MAAKGTLAKEYIAKKLAETFGSDYVGEHDKKYYVWGQENGEKVQIAITMTCPKTPIGTPPAGGSVPLAGGTVVVEDDSDYCWESGNVVTPSGFEPAKITPDEKANIAALMEKLGL